MHDKLSKLPLPVHPSQTSQASLTTTNSSFNTFEDFTKKVEETFGDPDSTRTACTKLHNPG